MRINTCFIVLSRDDAAEKTYRWHGTMLTQQDAEPEAAENLSSI